MAASISNTDLEKVRAAGAEKAASFTKTLLPKAEQFRTQTPYTGLSGVSGATGQKLGKYTGGYKPSQTVLQAQSYLTSVVSGKPGSYKNTYKQQLDDLYDQVINREKFSYDLAGDSLYRQYRDQYMNLGRQAMMDTAAQAASLTGGYGNSYAATAGNQAYQAYVQQLNNVAPQLYQLALGRYESEGAALKDKLDTALSLESADYSRWQDEYSRWQGERDFANADYWNKYGADYGEYADELDFWTGMADMENDQFNRDRDLAYDQAIALIKTGSMPDADLLDLSGITSSDAKKLVKFYGGGKKSSSGSSSKKKKTAASTVKKTTASSDSGYDGLSSMGKVVYNAVKSGGSAGMIDARLKKGQITAAEAETIRRLLAANG
ncbi:MAG: hypothetical protein E7337_10360 [Clostridiales bacterium]|nr:hypothetical protein [Clostridiales bacterium]